jgi:hypothetical protein
MFVVGAIANIAGLVTFLDWAAIKSKAKKEKKPLKTSMRSLGKLEVNLRKINMAIQEKKDFTEIKHCLDLICEAKDDLTEDLREMGIEIPQEEPQKIRGFSDDSLSAMLNICETGIAKAMKELSRA